MQWRVCEDGQRFSWDRTGLHSWNFEYFAKRGAVKRGSQRPREQRVPVPQTLLEVQEAQNQGLCPQVEEEFDVKGRT